MVVRIGSLIAGFISALRKILARRSRHSYIDNGDYVWDKGSFNRVYVDDPGSLFNRASTENINRKRVVLFSIDALRSDMVLNLTHLIVLTIYDQYIWAIPRS